MYMILTKFILKIFTNLTEQVFHINHYVRTIFKTNLKTNHFISQVKKYWL